MKISDVCNHAVSTKVDELRVGREGSFGASGWRDGMLFFLISVAARACDSTPHLKVEFGSFTNAASVTLHFNPSSGEYHAYGENSLVVPTFSPDSVLETRGIEGELEWALLRFMSDATIDKLLIRLPASSQFNCGGTASIFLWKGDRLGLTYEPLHIAALGFPKSFA